MGLFDLFKKKTIPVVDINEALRTKEENALVIDVRDSLYFGKGHVPGCMTLPIFIVGQWSDILPEDKNIPLYVYGKNDEEATRGAGYLADKKFFAFTKVVNMGGFDKYTGEKEEGLKPKKEIPF